MKCLTEGVPPREFIAAELENSGLYRMVCKERNHETVTCLQAQKFEVLFELAAHAIVDGYHREAITSFSSSLESFFEFAIDLIRDKHGVDRAAFEAAWRPVSRHSERQLGAYIFAFLLSMKRPPKLLPGKSVEFRNEVIHQGRIPSRQEAIQYGDTVADVVFGTLRELRANYDVQAAVMRYVEYLRANVTVPDVSFMGIDTFFGLTRPTTEPQPTLHEWLESLRTQRRLRG